MSMISDLVKKLRWIADYEYQNRNSEVTIRKAADTIEMLSEKARATEQEWIPCSERLPKDLEVVNITWINHRPMTYYADIKDKPFTATAIHYRDKWWWYSPICEDLLAEYGKSECDKMDADIEVIAWMELPAPYQPKGEQDGQID